MNVIFENGEFVKGISFDITVFDDGGVILKCKRRRTAFMVIYNPAKGTVSIRTRREWQLWDGVPSVWDMFHVLTDEFTSKKWTPAQADLMWDVAHI